MSKSIHIPPPSSPPYAADARQQPSALERRSSELLDTTAHSHGTLVSGRSQLLPPVKSTRTNWGLALADFPSKKPTNISAASRRYMPPALPAAPLKPPLISAPLNQGNSVISAPRRQVAPSGNSNYHSNLAAKRGAGGVHGRTDWNAK